MARIIRQLMIRYERGHPFRVWRVWRRPPCDVVSGYAEGWGLYMEWLGNQALSYLRDRAPLAEHEITTEIDRYIAWPGQALAYKLGELQIRRHRREAEEKLGAKFDIRRFHDAILAVGSVPLPVLEQRMNQFIAEERARAGTTGAP